MGSHGIKWTSKINTFNYVHFILFILSSGSLKDAERLIAGHNKSRVNFPEVSMSELDRYSAASSDDSSLNAVEKAKKVNAFILNHSTLSAQIPISFN